MTRRYLGILLCILILFLFSMFGLAAKRKSILRIPEGSVGIIAYGSLISLPSMEETLGRKYEGPIHEVHLVLYFFGGTRSPLDGSGGKTSWTEKSTQISVSVFGVAARMRSPISLTGSFILPHHGLSVW